MNDGQLVCVIDEDISAREAVVELLRSEGFATETIASAQDYLATPRAVPPGCLVLVRSAIPGGVRASACSAPKSARASGEQSDGFGSEALDAIVGRSGALR